MNKTNIVGKLQLDNSQGYFRTFESRVTKCNITKQNIDK